MNGSKLTHGIEALASRGVLDLDPVGHLPACHPIHEQRGLSGCKVAGRQHDRTAGCRLQASRKSKAIPASSLGMTMRIAEPGG